MKTSDTLELTALEYQWYPVLAFSLKAKYKNE